MRKESWIMRFGISLWPGRRQSEFRRPAEKRSVGVLTFEVASLMSKVVQLWYSLSDEEIIKLRDETLHLTGVRKLVSDDSNYLLSLALAETASNAISVAISVERLGTRCSDPVLRGLDHVLEELIKNWGTNSTSSWEFTWKKMKRKVKKMERFVAASANLYQEMEILLELEQGLKRFHVNAGDQRVESFLEYKRKVDWQRDEVKYLKDISIWNRSYDYAVRLLSRSLLTVVGRIIHVFGLFPASDAPVAGARVLDHLPRSLSISSLANSSVHPSDSYTVRFASGPLRKSRRRMISSSGSLNKSISKSGSLDWVFNSKSRWSSASKGAFGRCLTLGGGKNLVLHGLESLDTKHAGVSISEAHSGTESDFWTLFSSKLRLLLNAPPSSLGAAALALHYANVIIVIEKMITCPHLIAADARDDLYSMLPTSIRAALRMRLKSCSRNMESLVYDAALGAEWKEAVGKISQWLAPLAHNMIRWQSERNFEQQNLTSKASVLLLHTLYFADKEKTEAAITELLVGLNYLCRSNIEQQSKASGEGGRIKDRSESSRINESSV